jgi:hypothetical protein
MNEVRARRLLTRRSDLKEGSEPLVALFGSGTLIERCPLLSA